MNFELGGPSRAASILEQTQNSDYLWVLLKTLFQARILPLKNILPPLFWGNAGRDYESQIEHCGLDGVVGSL